VILLLLLFRFVLELLLVYRRDDDNDVGNERSFVNDENRCLHETVARRGSVIEHIEYLFEDMNKVKNSKKINY
jgi:hypothetical protein